MAKTYSSSMMRGLTAAIGFAFLVCALPGWAAVGKKAGGWADDWKTIKKEYEDLTGKKKPAPKILGMFGRGSTGVESALKKLDATWADVGKKKTQKSMDAYNAALASYTAVKNEYLKLIQKAMDEEQDEDSAYAKGLDVLKKSLDAIESSAQVQVKYLQSVTIDGEKMSDTIKKTLFESAVAAVKRAEIFISRVRAAKTNPEKIELFNKEIQDAARDVNQPIGNISTEMKFTTTDPKPLFEGLKVYAKGGAEGKLGDDANDQQIKDTVDDVAAKVQNVKQWLANEGW